MRPLSALLLALFAASCSVERSAIPSEEVDAAGVMDVSVDEGDVGRRDADADPSADADTDADADGASDADAGLCPGALGPDCRWSHRVRLTFDNTGQDEALSDFPVLVRLTDARVDYAAMRPGGADLRFVDSTLSRILPHEIEVWAPSGRSDVWVAVPSIAADSAVDHVWMYYGHPDATDAQDPDAVWEPGFELVFHLSRSVVDSSGVGNDGTDVGTTDARGQIGRARIFDGSAYVDSSYAAHLDVMTVEAWARGDDVPADDMNVALVGRNANYQLDWDHFSEFRAGFGLRASGAWQAASYQPVSAATWYYLVGTYDGATIRAYKDGALVSSNTALSGAPEDDAFPVRLGTNPDPGVGWFFEGRLDEVRISSVVRSDAWIRAQHLSMTDAFVTYGAPEAITP